MSTLKHIKHVDCYTTPLHLAVAETQLSLLTIKEIEGRILKKKLFVLGEIQISFV